MDDILYDWKKLSQTEEEDTKLSLSKSKNIRSKEFVLAAKFLTKRALNVEAIGRTFKPLWRAKKEFKVREEEIIFFFLFLNSNLTQNGSLPTNLGPSINMLSCYRGLMGLLRRDI